MKNSMLQFTSRVLPVVASVPLCLLLPFSSASDASPPSNEMHFHGVADAEAMRARDSIYVATKHALNLNVGEPRTVRMIYFLPNDRPFRQEVVDSMKVTIRQVQTFFADQMEAHGYGRKTFRYETDAQGEPQARRVDGQHPDSYYLDWPRGSVIYGELEKAFDLEANVYLIVIDNSIGLINTLYGPAGGVGQDLQKNGGWGMISGYFDWELVAHELGHGFGLSHDFRDFAYIMGYDSIRSRLSACNAEYLALHPHFNTDVPTEETSPPTIELVPSSAYPRSAFPAGSASVSLKFKVSDSEGLHQVNLRVLNRIWQTVELYACRTVAGETDATVEFEFDGVYPSGLITSLSDVAEHEMLVWAVDGHGNHANKWFSIFETSPHFLATLEGHTRAVNSLAFSPDGATLASGSRDGTVKLWDAKKRQRLASLDAAHESQEAKPAYAAFSPDGATLAWGAWEINLWDVATQTHIATLAPDGAASVTFSPNGDMLASASTNGYTVKLWDVRTRQHIATLEGHTDQVKSVAFSPDGAILASGSDDGGVKLWDVNTRQSIAMLEGHTDQVGSVAFSPDGAILASGSYDDTGRDRKTVKLWDVKTKQNIATFGPKYGTVALAFSPDGAILASQTEDRVIVLWDISTQTQIVTFAGVNYVTSLAFSADGATLASGDSDGNVLLWNMSEFVTPVAVIPDANLRAVVRDALGLEPFAPITVTEIARLTTLDASNRDIRELDGLESAANLTEVNLKGNPLSSSAIATQVPALQERGVAVTFDASRTPDFSGDGVVNFTDFLQFAANYGRSESDPGYDARFDLDGDGEIGFGDFLIFAGSFGN